ncbi:MAG TPA: hypothetical protein VF884_14150 [Nitrososphaeraceae archaeon]
MEATAAIDSFLILRNAFLDLNGNPKPFDLRVKRNTQNDPLDRLIVTILLKGLNDSICIKSSGPLISPDLVIYRRQDCENILKEKLRSDPSQIVTVEIKKPQRSSINPSTPVARISELNYITTPPCGTTRIYEAVSKILDVIGFYLFVCQELTQNLKYIPSALTLCDDNGMNEDFDLHLKITGQRQKEIGHGRNRSTLIFSNPVGSGQFDRACTLITRCDMTGSLRIKWVTKEHAWFVMNLVDKNMEFIFILQIKVLEISIVKGVIMTI